MAGHTERHNCIERGLVYSLAYCTEKKGSPRARRQRAGLLYSVRVLSSGRNECLIEPRCALGRVHGVINVHQFGQRVAVGAQRRPSPHPLHVDERCRRDGLRRRRRGERCHAARVRGIAQQRAVRRLARGNVSSLPFGAREAARGRTVTRTHGPKRSASAAASCLANGGGSAVPCSDSPKKYAPTIRCFVNAACAPTFANVKKRRSAG